MAITTSLKPSFAIRTGAIAVMCLVFGVWGLYDAFVKIPAQEEAYERLTLLESVQTFLDAEPSDPEFEARRREALDRTGAALAELSPALAGEDDLGRTTSSIDTPEALQEFLQSFADDVQADVASLDEADRQWFARVAVMRNGVLRRGSGPMLPAASQAARTVANDGMDALGSVKPPGKWDKFLWGWMFVICLPFAPYYAWRLMQARRQTVRFDDRGGLHLPDGQHWPAEEIDDIDMSRWMRKSVATVQHADGRTFRLDDYLHKGTHLIVGALAHRFHPEDWTEDARPAGSVPDPDETSGAAGEEAGSEPAAATSEDQERRRTAASAEPAPATRDDDDERGSASAGWSDDGGGGGDGDD